MARQASSHIGSVCVYCGSGPGADPAFVAAARTFGRLLAENGVALVYGGGAVGLMGELAAAVLEHGGHVTGIIPDFLVVRERLKRDSQDVVITRDMHERKQMMFDRADAFVALPGGVGTLEELVEQLTWAQLGRHTKPILIANIAGFWDPLCALLDHMRRSGFIHSEARLRYLVCDRVEDILARLEAAAAEVREPPPVARELIERM